MDTTTTTVHRCTYVKPDVLSSTNTGHTAQKKTKKVNKQSVSESPLAIVVKVRVSLCMLQCPFFLSKQICNFLCVCMCRLTFFPSLCTLPSHHSLVHHSLTSVHICTHLYISQPAHTFIYSIFLSFLFASQSMRWSSLNGDRCCPDRFAFVFSPPLAHQANLAQAVLSPN